MTRGWLLLLVLAAACAYARDGKPDAACEIVPSAGCPVGEACSVDPLNAAEGLVACRTIAREGGDVAPCALEAECSAGWTCQGARCLRYCRADGDCGGPGGLCLVPVVVPDPTGLPVTASGIGACTPDCDPLTGGRCRSGDGCPIVKEPGDPRFHTDCVPAGAGGHLASCATSADCAPGFVCQSNDGTLVCLARCVLGQPCAIAATTCTAQTARPTLAGVEYGVCLP